MRWCNEHGKFDERHYDPDQGEIVPGCSEDDHLDVESARLKAYAPRGHAHFILDPLAAERKATSFEAVVRALFAEAADLLLSKHNDYGPLNISLSPGGAMNGLRVRLYDKIARLNNLIDSGREPEHESIEDTWRDIVGYGAIGLLVSRGEWPDA